MARVRKWISEEFFRVLPGLIFFYLAFNLINYTEALMFRSEKARTFGFFTVLIAAGVVAKILLLIDHLPVISVFKKKPLIYGILWKTLIYGFVAFVIRYLTVLYPFYKWKEHSLDYERFLSSIDWTRFWAIQIWYTLLFFVFALSRAVIRAVGKERFYLLLFGPLSAGRES